jgi:hypothetical protein
MPNSSPSPSAIWLRRLRQPLLPANVESRVPEGEAELGLYANVIALGLERDELARIACDAAAHLVEQ